jgi:hypothetical protein
LEYEESSLGGTDTSLQTGFFGGSFDEYVEQKRGTGRVRGDYEITLDLATGNQFLPTLADSIGTFDLTVSELDGTPFAGKDTYTFTDQRYSVTVNTLIGRNSGVSSMMGVTDEVYSKGVKYGTRGSTIDSQSLREAVRISIWGQAEASDIQTENPITGNNFVGRTAIKGMSAFSSEQAEIVEELEYGGVSVQYRPAGQELLLRR